MHTLLLLHAAVTCILVGLIWTVQLVHYPLFRHASEDTFPALHADHARRITWLVGVLMPAELALACLLVIQAPSVLTVVGLLLVLAIWTVTALVQVPLHTRLGQHFDPETVARLVHSNWSRTILWTLRGLLACWLLR
jgi:hypothetical protein